MNAADDPRQKRRIVEQLRRSRVYREYEQAFRDCTGLPLSLRTDEGFDLAHRSDPCENSFCALLSKCNHACARCLSAQKELTDASGGATRTQECFAGLVESAVPVRIGDRTVAYLQTGQNFLRRPAPARLRQVTARLKALGLEADEAELMKAYARTRVVPRRQYDAVLQLLSIFAQQLGALSSQFALAGDAIEPPAIARARAYIREHHPDELTLATVARAVAMSPHHFCKVFHKSTGLTFTDYLAHVRVDEVRRRLLDPHTLISEAAYAAGFQSLSQFSRVFRRIAGESPSSYRAKLELAESA